MDIILSSSRGADVLEALKENHPNPGRLHFEIESGGQIENLAALVPSILKKYGETGDQGYHVYFVAGLCDVTVKDQDWDHGRYEEVIFTEPWFDAVNRVTRSIYSAIESVREFNVTPVFCTIPPCSFRVWNFKRLQQRKTSHLIHFNYYEDMQYSLISAIQDINRNILHINDANGVTTPYLASTVMENLGPNQRPRVHYNRFRDGVHAKKGLKEKWAKKLITAMAANRFNIPSPPQLTDSDAEDLEYVSSLVSSRLENVFDEARDMYL